MYHTRGRDINQLYLLPENIKNWVPEDDFSLILVDLVSVLDLTPIYAHYRLDGQGSAFYHPEIMVGLALYTYIQGTRSSRQIEKLCRYDVGYRIITRNSIPDHSTISRFFKNQGSYLASLFVQVLIILDKGGLIDNRILALDGTKMKADASLSANMSFEKIEKEIQKYVEEILKNDITEDILYGEENSGLEMPEGLRTHKERMKRFLAAKQRLEDEQKERIQAKEEEIKLRAEEETHSGKKKRGRKPKKPQDRPESQTLANLTDPDSSLMKSGSGYIQGYNAQAMANQDGIIIMPQISSAAVDYKLLQPSLEKLQEISTTSGIQTSESLILTDAGYWSHENYLYMKRFGLHFLCSTCHEPNVYTVQGSSKSLLELDDFTTAMFKTGCIPPISASIGFGCERLGFSEDNVPSPASIAKEIMKEKMSPYPAKKLYSRRKVIIEPIFGWIKENRGFRKFQRRGLLNCQNEWSLICLTQNLRTVMERGMGNKLKEVVSKIKREGQGVLTEDWKHIKGTFFGMRGCNCTIICLKVG